MIGKNEYAKQVEFLKDRLLQIRDTVKNRRKIIETHRDIRNDEDIFDLIVEKVEKSVSDVTY
jgi:predicted kinase